MIFKDKKETKSTFQNSAQPFAPYAFLFAPLRERLFLAKAQSQN